MGAVSNYKNLRWLLANNPSLVAILNTQYARNHSYFPHVDRLVGYLRKKRVLLLRNKADEAGNLEDFSSFVSELIFVQSLSNQGKRIKLIPTKTWRLDGQIPDFICSDHRWRVFVEVKRLTESEGVTMLTKGLQDYLRPQPYKVEVTISPKWTNPTNDGRSRRKRRALAAASLQQFFSLFPKSPIKTRYATYVIQQIQKPPGYSIIETPYYGDASISRYLRYNSVKAAIKRSSWVSTYPKSPYVAALDPEEIGSYDDITLTNTFYGATARGGAFRRKKELRNLSGVIIRRGSTHYFLLNPFADKQIRYSCFNQFLPKIF